MNQGRKKMVYVRGGLKPVTWVRAPQARELLGGGGSGGIQPEKFWNLESLCILGEEFTEF